MSKAVLSLQKENEKFKPIEAATQAAFYMTG
jgi:hypothetical protein